MVDFLLKSGKLSWEVLGHHSTHVETEHSGACEKQVRNKNQGPHASARRFWPLGHSTCWPSSWTWKFSKQSGHEMIQHSGWTMSKIQNALMGPSVSWGMNAVIRMHRQWAAQPGSDHQQTLWPELHSPRQKTARNTPTAQCFVLRIIRNILEMLHHADASLVCLTSHLPVARAVFLSYLVSTGQMIAPVCPTLFDASHLFDRCLSTLYMLYNAIYIGRYKRQVIRFSTCTHQLHSRLSEELVYCWLYSYSISNVHFACSLSAFHCIISGLTWLAPSAL